MGACVYARIHAGHTRSLMRFGLPIAEIQVDDLLQVGNSSATSAHTTRLLDDSAIVRPQIVAIMSSAPGSHTTTSPSASTFLATLIPVLIISSIILAVFLVFRTKVRRVYEPRTYIPLLHE